MKRRKNPKRSNLKMTKLKKTNRASRIKSQSNRIFDV